MWMVTLGRMGEWGGEGCTTAVAEEGLLITVGRGPRSEKEFCEGGHELFEFCDVGRGVGFGGGVSGNGGRNIVPELVEGSMCCWC